MRIDLAVYTGDSGYDWHHAGVFTRDELIAYKRIMGKFPDPDFGRMPFGGAFNEGNWLVFYRYHYAKRWDNLGRDSLYVALGRVPLASASAVDFKCAFALTEMNQPMKPFPTAASYIGPKAAVAPAFASQRLFTGTSALSYLGSWFASKPAGRLVVSIDGDYANPRILPRFEPAVELAAAGPVASPPAFAGSSSAGWMPGGRGAGVAGVEARRTVSLTACLALSAATLVLGGACGYAVRGWIGANVSLGGKIMEKFTEKTGLKIEKVTPQAKPETCATNALSTNSDAGQKTPADEPDAAECVRRGDAAMAEGNELNADYWYAMAEEKGSKIARIRRRVAQRALGDAIAEPSPAVIDNAICRAACTANFTGRLSAAVERLLSRYAAEPKFSIARASELSVDERHCLACELAVIGNDVGIAYLNKRKLIDLNDTRHGGVVHYAAAAGQEPFVKWIVGVCKADAFKPDAEGKTPCAWVDEELRACESSRQKALRRVRQYLASLDDKVPEERASGDTDVKRMPDR